MEEQDTLNKVYSYLFYGTAVLCLVAAALLSDAYLVLATAILLLASAAYLNSGHIINNLLVRHSAIVEVYNGCRLSERLDSVVRKVGDAYVSESFAVLRQERPVSAGHEAMRNLLESIREPFTFSVSLREMDRGRMVEGLETRRRMKEIALSRMAQGRRDRANALRREIDILNADMESIREGGKALEVLMHLSTQSSSHDPRDAARESSSSIRKVADAFSAALGVDYEVLSGEELLGFVEVKA